MTANSDRLETLREQLKPIFWDVYDPDSDTEGNVQAALDKAMPLIAGLLGGDPTEEQIEAATWELIEWDTDTADRGVSDEHYRERRAETERIAPILAAGVAPQEPSEKCTCPSGDGSLRWPCPSHPPAPSPDREKLIAELEFRSGKRAFPGETGYDQSHLDLMGVAADALAAQPVPDEVIERAERSVHRHLSRLSKRDDWAEDDTDVAGQAGFIVRVLAEEGCLAAPLDPEKVESWLSGPTHAPANAHSQADGSCTECPWPRYMLPASEWVADFCEAAKRGELSA